MDVVDLTACMLFPLKPYQEAREICQKQTEAAVKTASIILFPLFEYKDFFSLSWVAIFFCNSSPLSHDKRLPQFWQSLETFSSTKTLLVAFIGLLMTQKLKKAQFCHLFLLILMYIQICSSNYFIFCFLMYLLLDHPLQFVSTYFNIFLYSSLL